MRIISYLEKKTILVTITYILLHVPIKLMEILDLRFATLCKNEISFLNSKKVFQITHADFSSLIHILL